GSDNVPPPLAIAVSILPRCRTTPASSSSRFTSRSPKRATRSGSKPAKATRKLSRLRRIVSHERPDWKPSRQSRSSSPRSSSTGRPHSSSWYVTYSGSPVVQHLFGSANFDLDHAVDDADG